MRGTELMLKIIWKLSVVAVIFIFSLLVYTLVYKGPPDNPHMSKATKHSLMFNKHISTEHDIDCSYIHDIIRTRNELSRQLNNMRRIIGQMQCEISKNKTNQQGGWCKETSQENSTEHATDKTLIPQLSKLLSDKTVASFGDGPGIYKREIEQLGHVKLYDAFDGAPYCEETSHRRVGFMDLTIPQYGIRQYEWIISLEVAEHIPEKYEAVYLDNIFRHATEGIILSWAVPGQGGLSHINNKPIEYVTKVMRDNGFKIDAEKTMKLQESASFSWFKRNMNVYVRNTTTSVGSEGIPHHLFV